MSDTDLAKARERERDLSLDMLISKLRDGVPCYGQECRFRDLRNGCLCATAGEYMQALKDAASQAMVCMRIASALPGVDAEYDFSAVIAQCERAIMPTGRSVLTAEGAQQKEQA